ncbi:2-phosphosulfolactate phosphatase [Roseomonas sp. 18066]|uniref:2-phosphosulfolactate phosphatase n=1 Tax=Roseomonas sp. 18066 TaxID=2681412 RepID=UPI00135ACB65|nr:2-phosphosulfolactate phosphatase [Roseomonas sp. 18066]
MIRLEWGLAGLEALRDEVAVLIVVDVLSFGTALDVALARGVTVYPHPHGDEVAAAERAKELGALLARPRRAGGGQWSLSPASLASLPEGSSLLLPSPNGARLSLAAGATPLLAGCLRNAAAIAHAARQLAGGGAIGLVPAGERWPDGSLRPAVEDWLGAGAILSQLDDPLSPEAELARDGFQAAAPAIGRLLEDCVSGQELIGRGFGADVALAAALEVSTAAPWLQHGAFRPAPNW